MKLFLDTANISEIEQWKPTGLIDGITTNPTHISKMTSNPCDIIEKICTLMHPNDVSVEVTESTPDAVYKQAHEIANIASNIVVKIPCHKQYYKIINRLAKENVALNITLIFTLIQGLMMSKLGVQYISPFIGRWDDIDIEGSDLLHDLCRMKQQYNFTTEILAASIRHVRHFNAAIQAGVDITTIPTTVLEKATQHPLTDAGIKQFDQDWKKTGVTKFPR